MAEDFVEGWTGPIDYQLLSMSSCGAAEVGVNLTGFTVTLQAFGAGVGPLYFSGSAVAQTSSTGGKVQYQPASSCELKSAYSPIEVRFKVVDGAGKNTYFPNAQPELWTVRRF